MYSAYISPALYTCTTLTLQQYRVLLILPTSHFAYSHFAYSHFAYSHFAYSHFAYSHFAYSHFAYSHFAYLGA